VAAELAAVDALDRHCQFVDSERSPALDLNSLAVDDLAGVDGAAAALGAYRDRDAPL
jgi:hypothetical protein